MSLGLSIFLTSLIYAMLVIAVIWAIPKTIKDLFQAFIEIKNKKDDEEES